MNCSLHRGLFEAFVYNIRNLLCIWYLTYSALSTFFLRAFMYTIRDLLYVYCLTFSALFTPREATRSSNAWVRWCYKKLQGLWSSLQRIWGMLKLFGYSLNHWSPFFSCESILPQIKNIFKPRPPIISPSLQRTVLKLPGLVLSFITTNPFLPLLIIFLGSDR